MPFPKDIPEHPTQSFIGTIGIQACERGGTVFGTEKYLWWYVLMMSVPREDLITPVREGAGRTFPRETLHCPESAKNSYPCLCNMLYWTSVIAHLLSWSVRLEVILVWGTQLSLHMTGLWRYWFCLWTKILADLAFPGGGRSTSGDWFLDVLNSEGTSWIRMTWQAMLTVCTSHAITSYSNYCSYSSDTLLHLYKAVQIFDLWIPNSGTFVIS